MACSAAVKRFALLAEECAALSVTAPEELKALSSLTVLFSSSPAPMPAADAVERHTRLVAACEGLKELETAIIALLARKSFGQKTRAKVTALNIAFRKLSETAVKVRNAVSVESAQLLEERRVASELQAAAEAEEARRSAEEAHRSLELAVRREAEAAKEQKLVQEKEAREENSRALAAITVAADLELIKHALEMRRSVAKTSAEEAAESAPAEPSPELTIPEFVKALQELKRQVTRSEFLMALKTLRTFIANVLVHPETEKYCKVRIKNKFFSSRLGRLPGGIACMGTLGFSARGEHLVLDYTRHLGQEKVLAVLTTAKRILETSIATASARSPAPALEPSPAPAPALPRLSPAPGALGGMFGGGGLGGSSNLMQQMLQNPALMQQAQTMMSNPAMMQQARAMMSNPAMMQHAQALMQNPVMLQQAQAMVQNPVMMQQAQAMMSNPALVSACCFLSCNTAVHVYILQYISQCEEYLSILNVASDTCFIRRLSDATDDGGLWWWWGGWSRWSRSVRSGEHDGRFCASCSSVHAPSHAGACIGTRRRRSAAGSRATPHCRCCSSVYARR